MFWLVKFGTGKILLAVLILGAAIAGLSSKTILKSYQGPRSVSFYPKANVYYDNDAHTYTYFNTISHTWITGNSLPGEMKSMLDKKVDLHTSIEPVWKYNQEDRINSAVALYAVKEDLKERPLPPPPVKKIYHATAPKPKESGIKHFFKKLFNKLR